jgi:predicted secreted protein
VTYTSDLNYSGPDDFHYTISDGHGGGDDATASVGVIAVADAPALTVTTVAGAHVNEIQVTVSAAVTDTDGSEYIDRFQFSNLPSGVQLLGQTGGVIDPAGHPASLTQVLTLVLPMDVDTNFDFTVTAVSKEVSNGDEATSAHTTDVVLDANSTTVNETFTATDQSIWGSGDQFTFTDDRFLGFSGSFGDSTGGFIYGDASASITAGFQSRLTFEGGQIDASAPYDITIDTNFNRTTDVLLISGSNTLGPASFTTAGPAGSYVLDFIFNYALHAALGIDFEIDSYDLFSFDVSGNHTINILNLQSADIGASFDLPYGLSVDLAWPNVDTTSGASLTNQFSSSGTSNNFLQLNVDVDQALADIFLNGVNPFTASFDVGVAGGTAELLDLDLSGGLNFIQDFLMTVKSLTGVLTFENGATRAYDFSDIVLDHASGYDANHDGIVQFVLSLAPNVDLHNSTDLGFNIGYSFDLLKASGWWDVALDSGSWSEGPVYHTGGTMPVTSVEVYDSTFALNFGSQDLVFGA